MDIKKFCTHGMVSQMCLKCRQNLATAVIVGSGGDGAVQAGGGFNILKIPDVMEKLHGVQGPLFMRRWFAGTASILDVKVKSGEVDVRTLGKQHIKDDLPFSWLETSPRVSPIIKDTVEALSEVNEFSALIGKTKDNPLDQLSRGLIVFMKRLARLGLLDEKKKTLVNGSRFFGDLPAIELDYNVQFTRVDVGTSLWEKALDDLDDVYFALGAFSVKLAATEFRTYANLNGYSAIEISEIGMYVRDTYDFLNQKTKNGGEDDQLLGYWSMNGVYKPDPVEYLVEPDRIYRWFKPYYKVMNSDYNNYRDRTGKGGDFMVFSTVKRVPVSILVHLSAVDFDEYLGRKDGKGL